MYSGGGERTAIYQALLLRKLGHEVSCFAPAIRSDLCFPDLITQIDLKGVLPRVRVGFPYRDFASLTATSILAPMFARRFKEFDVVLSHGQPATWVSYLVSKQSSRPRVVYLHQPARFLYPRAVDLRVGWTTKRDFALLESMVNVMKPFATSFDHVSVVSSQKVLVNSQWIGAQVKQIYNIEPLLCPPGADVGKLVPVENKQDVVINGRTIKKPFVLSTNRHYPQKGLSDLIIIYAKVRQRAESRLVLTGHFTDYTDSLKKQTAELGLRDSVLFTGQIAENDLVKLYQNADVYAFTPPEEDFGLGPIEAMASGTPAVVWDNAGPSETVIDGVTGLRAELGNKSDFASKLVQLLLDKSLNKEMCRNAAEYVRRNYTWSKHVETLERVLAESCS